VQDEPGARGRQAIRQRPPEPIGGASQQDDRIFAREFRLTPGNGEGSLSAVTLVSDAAESDPS